MKKTSLFFLFFSFLTTHGLAKSCFIVKEKGQVLIQEGDCDTPYSPCSTFKIPLSLMGYDSGIFKTEGDPKWSFKEGYTDYLEKWKQDHTPTTWINNSCVWFSQVLTEKLGRESFKNYVMAFDYGNRDISGDKGKDNGLTRSWLSSSLEISSLGQIAFLEKFINQNLPVKPHAYEMTKHILFVEELPGGWKLYGKTGGGVLLNQDRTEKLNIQHGWFIGWVEKEGRTLLFSNHITDDKPEERYASQQAKAEVRERISQIIGSMES